MPVKRRASKRRITPEAELDAWQCVFECGWDFFGDAAELTGLSEPVHVPHPEQRAEAELLWSAAVLAAWQRLGPRFLEAFSEDRVPWAVQEFGRSWETTHAA